MQEPRRRPLWLVAVLTVLSFGAYLPIWYGLSWAELKRETEGAAWLKLTAGEDGRNKVAGLCK